MIGSSMMSNGKWKLKTPNEKMANNTRTRQTKQKSDENTYTKIPKYTLSNSSKASLNSALRSSSRLVPILFFFTKINICMIWKLKSLTYSVPPHFSLFLVTGGILSPEWLCLFTGRGTTEVWAEETQKRVTYIQSMETRRKNIKKSQYQSSNSVDYECQGG